jgi:hypothetical protein
MGQSGDQLVLTVCECILGPCLLMIALLLGGGPAAWARCRDKALEDFQVFALQAAEWGVPFGAAPRLRVPAAQCWLLYKRATYFGFQRSYQPERGLLKSARVACLRAGLVPPVLVTNRVRWLVPTSLGPVWLTRVNWNTAHVSHGGSDDAAGRHQTLRLTPKAQGWAEQGRRTWGRGVWPVVFGYALVLTGCWKVYDDDAMEALLRLGFQRCSPRLDAQLRVIRVLRTGDKDDEEGVDVRRDDMRATVWDMHMAAAGDPEGQLRAGDPLVLYLLTQGMFFDCYLCATPGWLARMAKVACVGGPLQFRGLWFGSWYYTYSDEAYSWMQLAVDEVRLPCPSWLENKQWAAPRAAWAAAAGLA